MMAQLELAYKDRQSIVNGREFFLSGISKVNRLFEDDLIKLILRLQAKVNVLKSELNKDKESNTPQSLGECSKPKIKLRDYTSKQSNKHSAPKNNIETANKLQIDKRRGINPHNCVGCDSRNLENEKVKKFTVAAIPEIIISQIVKSETEKNDSIERLVGILI